MSKFALLAALFTAVAAAPASTVKPLTVGLNQLCFADGDCATNYCSMTNAQRQLAKPRGKCANPLVNGAKCYSDSGCKSLNCGSGKCTARPARGPQMTCTKLTTDTLYLGTMDASAFTTSPVPQPYLGFNGIISSDNYDAGFNYDTDVSTPVNEDILSTTDKSGRQVASFYQCTPSGQSAKSAIRGSGIQGQVRFSDGTCLTRSRNVDTAATFYKTACSTEDNLLTSFKDSYYPTTSTSFQQMFQYTAPTANPPTSAQLRIGANFNLWPGQNANYLDNPSYNAANFGYNGLAAQTDGSDHATWTLGLYGGAAANDPTAYLVTGYTSTSQAGQRTRV